MEGNGNGKAEADGRGTPTLYIERWIRAAASVAEANRRYPATVKRAEQLLQLETAQARAQIEGCRRMLAPLVRYGEVRAVCDTHRGPELVVLRPSSVYGVEMLREPVTAVDDLEWPDAPIPADTPASALPGQLPQAEDDEPDWDPDDVVVPTDPSVVVS